MMSFVHVAAATCVFGEKKNVFFELVGLGPTLGVKNDVFWRSAAPGCHLGVSWLALIKGLHLVRDFSYTK